MVLYFSATGNTEMIAREIAKRMGDESLNLLSRIKSGDFSPIHSETPFVICAPVYVCEPPRFLMRYLKKTAFTGSRDVYFLLTSGGYAGPSGLLLRHIFRRKRMRCHGHAEFKMPRNYVVSDAYAMLEKNEVEARLIECYRRLDAVASDIMEGRRLTARHVFLFETLITLPFNPIWCRYKLTAKDFFAKDSCIGCGKCERLCPLGNIKLTDGRPIWSNDCTHCMACIGNCPTEAIGYGTVTEGKEPYRYAKYSYVLRNPETDETGKSE